MCIAKSYGAIFLIGLLALTTGAEFSRGPCPESGDLYNPRYNAQGTNGSCWRHIPQMKTWTDARIHCIKLGGDLAEIRNDEDNDLFEELQPMEEWTWHGMSDRISESAPHHYDDPLSGWYYLDGSPISYENFDTWEANDAGGLDGGWNDRFLNGEDCVHMWGTRGKWNDLPCDAWKPFICAIPLAAPRAEICEEQNGKTCHHTAYCEKVDGVDTCFCPVGYHGNGIGSEGCSSSGYTVRFNIYLPGDMIATGDLVAKGRGEGFFDLRYFHVMRDQYASLLTPEGYRTGGSNSRYTTEGWGQDRTYDNRRSLPTGFLASMEHTVTDLDLIAEGYEMMTVAPSGTKYMLTVNSIFPDMQSALNARAEMIHNLKGNHTQFYGYSAEDTIPLAFGVRLTPDNYPLEPRVYRWVAESAGAELQIMATGLTVETMHFEPNCETSGCWILEIIFSIGRDNFNTFFLPQATGDETLSSDFDYDVNDLIFTDTSPADTFVASNFPCQSFSYDPESDDPFHPVSPPEEVTACCMPKFLGMYRPIQRFVSDVETMGVTKASCDQGIVPTVARPFWNAPPLRGPMPYSGAGRIQCSANVEALVGSSPFCYALDESSGRIDHEYAPNDARAWLVSVPGAQGNRSGSSVEIVFEFFDVEEGDRLRLFSCEDAFCSKPTLVADATGAYDPFAITVCTGHILVTFRSDSTKEAPGFMARFYSLPGCPVANDLIDKSLRAPGDGSVWPDPNSVQAARRGTVPKPKNSLYGNFKGMDHSYVRFKSVEDPYIGQYRAEVTLDATELRSKAGILRGIPNVEYTVDTFLGLANFKPSGLQFLDPSGMQVGLHIEKTRFFSVATHGTNDYTFVQYANLRLVTVREEQVSGRDTESVLGSADYLQVTFTLGGPYRPAGDGLIPLDSVRVGKGTFFAEADMTHVCSQYTQEDNSFDGGNKALFDSRFSWETSDAGGATNQRCSPDARMCVSPADTPDNFVSFNVPLGIDWLPKTSSDLTSNVFVDMVVSAIDATATGTPNAGDSSHQVKTTLTASVPVVLGGVNVFCDSLVSRSNLKDVADADIIVGSVGFAAELPRIRILRNIASSVVPDVEPQLVDSDSIEAGLLTLVLKGNASYFGLGGTRHSALQLEDVITLHIMEPKTTMKDAVMALINAPPSPAISDLYPLNAAFEVSIDRAANRASLHPTFSLEVLCPQRPRRPSSEDEFPTTCVMRRDVQNRDFPTGNTEDGVATAFELPSFSASRTATSGARAFMQSVMGPSNFAAELGQNFSKVVADAYNLNGQSVRAFWINPGYEWTAAQTGGQALFTVSQTIVMVALVNLDEGLGGRRHILAAESGADVAPGTGLTFNTLEFTSTPQGLLMQAFNVPESHVVALSIVAGLSPTEACLPGEELKALLTEEVTSALSTAASPVQTVQLLNIVSDSQDVNCRRRRELRSRSLQATAATASFEAMVVFKAAATPRIDADALQRQQRFESVEAVQASEGVIGPLRPGDSELASGEDGRAWKVGLMATAGGAAGMGLLMCAAVGLFVKMQGAKKAQASRSNTVEAELVHGDAKSAAVDRLRQQLREAEGPDVQQLGVVAPAPVVLEPSMSVKTRTGSVAVAATQTGQTEERSVQCEPPSAPTTGSSEAGQLTVTSQTSPRQDPPVTFRQPQAQADPYFPRRVTSADAKLEGWRDSEAGAAGVAESYEYARRSSSQPAPMQQAGILRKALARQPAPEEAAAQPNVFAEWIKSIAPFLEQPQRPAPMEHH